MRGLTKRWKSPNASDPRLGLVDRILEARGFETMEERDLFLNPSLKDLEKPATLHGAVRAGELLVEAVREHKRILIFGDYDADGITAAAVLFHIITAARSGEVPTLYIPDRLEDGYGIHPESIETFASQAIDLVITVDCGITAVEAAEKAKELGISLIITDHHTLRKDGQLPDCDAIVHPALNGKPTTPYAGVGVAYQVAWAFAEVWSKSPSVNEKLRDVLLDLVPMTAVGTIADMVPLNNSNRIFAKWGLQMLPSTNNNGLRAMMREIRTPAGGLSSADVSFGIAPLINAAGRMSHAAIALDLLTHLEGKLADAAARELCELNRKRQRMQRTIEMEAKQMIEAECLDVPSNRCIVLHKEEWARGIIGICAGQLVAKVNRPIIMLATEGEHVVGSARSISGYSILEGLQACDSLLVSYGGHAAAAGVTLLRENYDAFVAAITAHANAAISEDELVPSLTIDTVADISELTLESACEIAKIGPFGIGNPNPRVRINGAKVVDCSTMGQLGAHATLRLSQGSGTIRSVWWNHGELADRIHHGETIDLVTTLNINEYRGVRTPQLKIEDVKLPSG